MSGEFCMPSLGADMDAGTLVEWLVKPGDAVKRGDIVAVVETQKGAIDVEIYEDGVIERLVVEVGTEVPVGTVLATLEGHEEHPVATPKPTTDPSTAPPASKPAPPVRSTPSRVAASPRARRRATELGVALETITGTGPEGAITFDDVEAAARTTTPAAGGDAMRAAIAAAMSRANREIPHYYLGHTIDLEPALSWLEAGNRDRPVRERILPIAVLVRAVATSLREYPQLCGWYRDDRFVPSDRIDVGLAVVTRSGGLLNPAIPAADEGDLPGLWAKIKDVTERARKGGLRASELGGGAITISSLGDRGVDTVYGVIHPPQVALVGIGTIAKRPWVVDGALAVRRTVELTLAADHRATDGHLGARFLQHVARRLSTPDDL